MRVTGSLKWCPRCHDFLDAGKFGRDMHRPDGLHVYCKKCRRPFKQRELANPKATFYCGSDYPNRMSVPNDKRIEFDQLTNMGEPVIIIDGSGREYMWADLD